MVAYVVVMMASYSVEQLVFSMVGQAVEQKVLRMAAYSVA